MTQKMNRRKFLALAGSVAGAGVVAACAAPTPQVIEKVVTQVVEKEKIVEKKVEVVQTKEVVKEVQKEVVKQITPTPGPKLTVWIPKHFIQVANDYCTDSILLAAAQNGFSADVQAFPWGEYNQKQAASIEAKNTPDLCLGVDTVRYQALGVLQEVGDVFKEVGDSGGGFFPDRIAQSTIGGKVYSVPFHSEPQVMYYRKDILKQQGLEKPPVTMAEFLDFAKKATQPDKKIWGWGNTFSNAPDGNNCFYPWMWAYGARMQDKTGKITVNSPETLEALTAYCDMYTKHKVMPPGATGWDDTGNNKAWLSGQMASIFNSGSIIWTMRTTDTALLNNTMFGPVPGKDKEGAKGPSSYNGGNFYGIFTFTKFAEQAKKMIKGSLSPQRYPGQMNAANGMFYPVMKNYIGADIYKNDQWNAQVVELTKVARNAFDEGEPQAWIGEVGAQWLISQMTSKVVVDGVEPKKALDEFEKKVLEIQAKYKK
jgi:multiple sugar transport system substrate-binding protein